jgi:hypothetical protein
MKAEFRVTWQREGSVKTSRLYQTLEGASRCVERQRTAREEMEWLNDPESPLGDRRPSEIVFGPVIEQRLVGDWAALDV